MKKLVFAALVLMSMSTALLASVSSGYLTWQMSVPSGFDSGTLSYNQYFFAATTGGEIEILSDDGIWLHRGFQGNNPVWSSDGTLYYDANGFASIYQNGQTRQVSEDVFNSPVAPVSNGNGEVLFADKQGAFLIRAKSDDTTEKVFPFAFLEEEWGGPLNFQVSSVCYVSNSDILTSGFQLAHFGYRVVDGDSWALSTYPDPCAGPLKIVNGGGKVWGLQYDSQSIVTWDWDNGMLRNQKTVVSGGTYDLLGADSEGAVYTDGNGNIWHISSAVPEPGSCMALVFGLTGLGGLSFRRRKQ